MPHKLVSYAGLVRTRKFYLKSIWTEPETGPKKEKKKIIDPKYKKMKPFSNPIREKLSDIFTSYQF